MFNIESLSNIDKALLSVWIVCDGTIVDFSKYNKNYTKIRIQFHLSRPDKIKRLEILLNRLGIIYSERQDIKSKIQKVAPIFISINGLYAREIFKLFPDGKHFDFIKNTDFNIEEKSLILNELAHTDGRYMPNMHRIEWKTTEEYDFTIIENLILNNIPYFKYKYKHVSGFGMSKKPYIFKLMCRLKDRKGHELIREVDYEKVFCI